MQLAGCLKSVGGLSMRHLQARCESSFALYDRARRIRTYATDQQLAQKRCEPCERAKDSLDQMGLSMTMDVGTAKRYLTKVDNWQLVEDENKHLRIRKTWRSKNFIKGLQLCQRIGEVAEAEGHHPDLHLVGWNNLTVEIWTHARDGLSENDFILAAKIDMLAKDDLLSKKQPPPA